MIDYADNLASLKEMPFHGHDHFTRGRKDIHLEYCRTKKRQLTVMFQGPKIWNSLTKLRESPSINIFTKKMKLSFFAI